MTDPQQPNNIKDDLTEAFRLLKKTVKATGVNLIDNYSYREYTATEVLREHLPSIKKTIGRSGDDASAEQENYFKIEQKSGTNENKTLTMSCFPKMMFDKQSDAARRDYIYKYDGFSLSFFEYYVPYPTAVVFVPKEYVTKLHPLFRTKQKEKIKIFEQKASKQENIGHDAITVSIEEMIEHIGAENMICWLYGVKIDSRDFFQQVSNKTIKINQ
jgi:hypothetical protein